MFDRLVKGGRMPLPVQIGGRKVWDRCALDRAFNVLSGTAAGEPDHWTEYLRNVASE